LVSRLYFTYRQHFKLIIGLNLFVGIYFTGLFWLKGYHHYPLYILALFFKVVTYAISVGIEKLFFQNRAYHYRNLGFSYRMLFGYLYILDFLFFIVLFLISLACKTYI